MEDVLDAAQVRVRGHRLHHQQFYSDADRLLADLAVSAGNCDAGETELSSTGFSLCAFRWTQYKRKPQRCATETFMLTWRCLGEKHAEACALGGVAVQADRAAMVVHDFGDDGKPESHSILFLRY